MFMFKEKNRIFFSLLLLRVYNVFSITRGLMKIRSLGMDQCDGPYSFYGILTH